MTLYDIWSVRNTGNVRALVCAWPQDEGRPKGDVVKYLATAENPNTCCAALQEKARVYLDMHPLPRGSIERAVRDKFGCISLDRPNSWEYWAKRYLDEIRKEMKRRRMVFVSQKHREIVEARILWELWRI